MRCNLPPLESLWVFHILATSGSLTAAAATLGVTQPAVSKRVRDLEAVLGCALVRRGANAISLTALGQRYAAEIAPGFAQLQVATQTVLQQTVPLRIRAYTTWALRWLIPRLADFHDQHPGIEVVVTTSTASVDLAREGVDAAISTAPCDQPPSPTARRLQAVVVAPFATPALTTSWIEGSGKQRLIGSKVRADDWLRWQSNNTLEPLVQPLLYESTTLAIQAALEGLGVVICTPAFVVEEVTAGRLITLPGHPLITGDCYWLSLPSGRITAPLRMFVGWLEKQVISNS